MLRFHCISSKDLFALILMRFIGQSRLNCIVILSLYFLHNYNVEPSLPKSNTPGKKLADISFDFRMTFLVFLFSRANQRLEQVRKTREAEVAKLQAQLRKADMRVTSLQRTLDQKARENQELTKICDELIEKVGK